MNSIDVVTLLQNLPRCVRHAAKGVEKRCPNLGFVRIEFFTDQSEGALSEAYAGLLCPLHAKDVAKSSLGRPCLDADPAHRGKLITRTVFWIVPWARATLKLCTELHVEPKVGPYRAPSTVGTYEDLVTDLLSELAPEHRAFVAPHGETWLRLPDR